jgi:fermentation-respiration switch protein FrsA (DUF1100 family)
MLPGMNTTTKLFRLAVATVGLHIADDNFIQPAAGNAAKVGSMAVFTNETPPANLRNVVARIAPRPILLIAAPNTKNGEKLNRGYYAAAREPKTLWEIPESDHVGGMEARPDEYERRVVGFFDDALR